MIWRTLLAILFINFGYQSVYGFNKFETNKKYINTELESQYVFILDKINTFDTIDVKDLNDSFYQKSIEAKNDYYINLALGNYVDYYTIQGQLSNVVELYHENINQPRNKHLLSYIHLLSKYYYFFYNYGATNECTFILKEIYRLKDFLPHKEKLYATSIAYIYDGLIDNDSNKFELKKNLLLEAIQIIEHLKNELTPYEYNTRLSSAYNHLAICYVNYREINPNLDLEYDVSEMQHAASLIRKAIRINKNSNLFYSAIYKSNLAFVNNILKNSEDAIYYGNRSIFLANKIKNKEILLRRSACNVADTYMFNKLTNSISYKEAYDLCIKTNEKYLKDKSILLQALENIKHPKEITYEKNKLSIITCIGIILACFTVLTVFIILLKKINKNKKS